LWSRNQLFGIGTNVGKGKTIGVVRKKTKKTKKQNKTKQKKNKKAQQIPVLSVPSKIPRLNILFSKRGYEVSPKRNFA
jgi:hypothetical protein